MNRWSVRKRDGVWQAFDDDGDVRFASSDWFQALTFALIGAEPRPITFFSIDYKWLQKFFENNPDEGDK